MSQNYCTVLTQNTNAGTANTKEPDLHMKIQWSAQSEELCTFYALFTFDAFFHTKMHRTQIIPQLYEPRPMMLLFLV